MSPLITGLALCSRNCSTFQLKLGIASLAKSLKDHRSQVLELRDRRVAVIALQFSTLR